MLFRGRQEEERSTKGKRAVLDLYAVEKRQNVYNHEKDQTNYSKLLNAVQTILKNASNPTIHMINPLRLYFIVRMREKHNTGRSSPEPNKNNSLNALRQQLKNKLIEVGIACGGSARQEPPRMATQAVN